MKIHALLCCVFAKLRYACGSRPRCVVNIIIDVSAVEYCRAARLTAYIMYRIVTYLVHAYCDRILCIVRFLHTVRLMCILMCTRGSVAAALCMYCSILLHFSFMLKCSYAYVHVASCVALNHWNVYTQRFILTKSLNR